MKNKLALPAAATALAGPLLAVALVPAAWGQGAATPEPAASAESARDRAAREGDKVFKWILMHADKPRKAREPAKEAQAVAPGAAAAPPPAAPAREVRAEAAKPAGTRSPAPSPAPASGPSPRPAERATSPALAALTPPPETPTKTAAAPAPEEESDEALVLKSQVDPEFSATLMRNMRKGTVQVKFTVQPDGSVGGAEVVKTSHVRLNQAALSAVQQWRFQPIHHAQLGIVELGFNLD